MRESNKCVEDLEGENNIGEITYNRAIVNSIERLVETDFDAEPSRLNLNNWKLRFDVDVETQEELNEIIERINTFVEQTNEELFGELSKEEYDKKKREIEWWVITTDSSNNHDGFTYIGKWGTEKEDVNEGNFPIKAFKISVRDCL